MIYQYIFGRDTEIGYKTINASTKLRTEGEYIWQSKLNIEYIPPVNITDNYPEPVVYFNIKNQTAVIGKIVYQTGEQRNNYMQHYYLLEGQEREDFLTGNYQFDIRRFENNIEDAYNSDIENQNIYKHIPFTIEDIKNILSYQNISKRVLELIVFACFEAVSSDKKVFFITDFSDKNSVHNNLELVKIIFSMLPYEFKEKLGFITYYKHLVSPIGKALRSDIKLVFTENSEQNLIERKKVLEDGNYLFDFITNKNAINTENILFGSLLELLTEPFFGIRPIEEVANVLNKIVSFFLDPYKINYNLAAIAYETLYRGRAIDYKTANILFDNFELLGEELRNELKDWFLSEQMKITGNELVFYTLLFKAYNYEEYKDKVIDYFAEKITTTKETKYIDVIFDKQTPFKIMDNVCKKLLNDEKFLEGGRFLVHNCILNTWDKSSNMFHSIEVFDVIKYFAQFSEQYYKYFDELEIYEKYFKENIIGLDINGFENLSNSFNKLIDSVENEATAARFRILHRLILQKYFMTYFKTIGEYSNLQSAIDICFRLFKCVKLEQEYFHKDLENCFREFSLNLVSHNNISDFSNIDYYFRKSIENVELLDKFLNVLEEILIKSFSKKDLSTKEYNNLFSYALQLGIKINTSKIKNFDILQFNSELKIYMSDNNIHEILKLMEKQASCLKLDTKNELITWLKKGYKGSKSNEFFRLLIYLYGDDYNNIFSFINKNDNYISLEICMKEMKSLGQTSNKAYLEVLSEYIKEDKKLKKHFKSVNANQKKELGLNSLVSNSEKQSEQKNSPFILYIIIYILLSSVIFLATKYINSTFGIENILVTWFINVFSALGIYSFWLYKASNLDYDFVAITKILTGLISVILIINIILGVLGFSKPDNVVLDLYKQVYSIKHDNSAPDVSVRVVSNNGDLNILKDVANETTINQQGDIAIILDVEDESEFKINAKLNDIDKTVEKENIIKINYAELSSINSKLVITAEDKYKNTSEFMLNITKQGSTSASGVNATFESTVYNELGASTEYPDVSNGFKLSVPKNGKLEFIFNIESNNKYIVNAKLNDIVIPLQTLIFLESGCRGKLVFDYDNLEDTNVLSVEVSSQSKTEEYKIDIVRTSE